MPPQIHGNLWEGEGARKLTAPIVAGIDSDACRRELALADAPLAGLGGVWLPNCDRLTCGEEEDEGAVL